MGKRYKVKWQDGKVVSIEVNGARFDDPLAIADRKDRAAILRLMSRPPAKRGELFDEREFERDIARLQRETAHMPKLIVAVFLAVALLMLAIAAVSGVITARAVARELNVPGWVVEVVARTDSSGQVLYYPMVEFQPAGGSSRLLQMDEGSSAPAYRVGQELVVRYDPQSQSARIPSLGGTVLVWLVTLITGFLGVVFLGATALAYWLVRSDVQAELSIKAGRHEDGGED